MYRDPRNLKYRKVHQLYFKLKRKGEFNKILSNPKIKYRTSCKWLKRLNDHESEMLKYKLDLKEYGFKITKNRYPKKLKKINLSSKSIVQK